jgi:predicted ArsR family transcriptional regulator
VDDSSTRERLVQLLRSSGGCTIADLQRLTGLSRSTVRQHLARLLRQGVVQGQVVRRAAGRPPRVYRLASALPPVGAHDDYPVLLRALHQAWEGGSRREVEAAFAEVADRVAAAHPEVRRIPHIPARLEAACQVFFRGADPQAVVSADGGWQVSITACPLAPLALQFGDLCRLARLALSALTGLEIEQSEWITRGDPRCTFDVRAPGPPT